MIALLACILASTFISLLFKWFGLYGIRNLPAIVVNYYVCVLIGTLYEGRWVLDNQLWSAPWLWVAGILGFLFIGGFNLNALSVQRAGIAVTSVVQRISLLLSVSFAVLVLNDTLSPKQGLGIASGVMAVLLVVDFRKRNSLERAKTESWLLPLGVFLVAGAIESLLSLAQRFYRADSDVFFSVALFAWAAILGTLFLLLRPKPAGVQLITGKEIIAGIALGIPNFFSIHLILIALGQGLTPTLVFPVLNIATILLGTLAAVAIFKERLSPKQWIGILLALIAIALIIS